VVFCTSCSEWFAKGSSGDEQSGEAIARVYDRYLYRSDIKNLIGEDTPSEDSASIVQNYITLWAKEQLLVYKAEYNLSAEQKNFEDQIEKYRRNLLTFTYQGKYVEERLDTNISEGSIREYYEAHADNFLLKENILKVSYAIVADNAPKIGDAIKWFKSVKPEDQQKLKSYLQKNAREFSLEDTAWISFDAITRKIPIETYNQVEFLNRNKVVEIQRDGYVFLLRIKHYKIADSSSPLPYVRDVIRNILLNQQKLRLLEELQKNLLSDALENNEFETY
jgi:hypothetical protein